MRHRRFDMQNLRLVLLNHVLRLSEIELTSDLIIDKLGLARNYKYSRFNFQFLYCYRLGYQPGN